MLQSKNSKTATFNLNSGTKELTIYTAQGFKELYTNKVMQYVMEGYVINTDRYYVSSNFEHCTNLIKDGKVILVGLQLEHGYWDKKLDTTNLTVYEVQDREEVLVEEVKFITFGRYSSNCTYLEYDAEVEAYIYEKQSRRRYAKMRIEPMDRTFTITLNNKDHAELISFIRSNRGFANTPLKHIRIKRVRNHYEIADARKPYDRNFLVIIRAKRGY